MSFLDSDLMHLVSVGDYADNLHLLILLTNQRHVIDIGMVLDPTYQPDLMNEN